MMEVIASQYDEATEALVRAIEEARLENRKNFETLIGMIRGLMREESTPSPGSLEEGEAKITDVKLMEVPTTTKLPNSAQENQPAPASVMSTTRESRNAASATITGETSDKEACRDALMPLSPLNSASITPERSTLVQRTSGVLGHNVREFADSNRAPVSHSQGCNDPTVSWGISIRRDQEFNIDAPRQNFEAIEAPGKEDNGNRDELQPQLSKVNFTSLHKFQKQKMGVEMPMMIKDAETGLTGVIEFWQNSVGILASSSADQVFVEMSRLFGMTIFDPGGWQNVNSIGMEKMMLGVGRKLSECVGIPNRFEPFELCSIGTSYGVSVLEASNKGVGFVFDPGIVNDVMYSFKFIKDGMELGPMANSWPYDRGK